MEDYLHEFNATQELTETMTYSDIPTVIYVPIHMEKECTASETCHEVSRWQSSPGTKKHYDAPSSPSDRWTNASPKETTKRGLKLPARRASIIRQTMRLPL